MSPGVWWINLTPSGCFGERRSGSTPFLSRSCAPRANLASSSADSVSPTTMVGRFALPSDRHGSIGQPKVLIPVLITDNRHPWYGTVERTLPHDRNGLEVWTEGTRSTEVSSATPL